MTLPVASLCLVRFGDLREEELRRHDGASSDGHLAHIFRHAAKELFNEDVGEVTYRTLRCVRTPTVRVCVCALGATVQGRVPKACACWGGCPVCGVHTVKIRGLSVFAQRPFVLPTFRTRWKRPSSCRRTRRVTVHCSFHRNKDFQEVTLERDGEVLLRFAAAYGFRNIQNVVLKLKRGKFPYHFVEVLACAGGEAWPHPESRSAPAAVGSVDTTVPLFRSHPPSEKSGHSDVSLKVPWGRGSPEESRHGWHQETASSARVVAGVESRHTGAEAGPQVA